VFCPSVEFRGTSGVEQSSHCEEETARSLRIALRICCLALVEAYASVTPMLSS
jgi:hypothetical protein